MEARPAFAHMALYVAMHHIVFGDEMWVEFNSIREDFNSLRKRVEEPNQGEIDNKEVWSIRIMFSGAICMSQQGPYH